MCHASTLRALAPRPTRLRGYQSGAAPITALWSAAPKCPDAERTQPLNAPAHPGRSPGKAAATRCSQERPAPCQPTASPSSRAVPSRYWPRRQLDAKPHLYRCSALRPSR